jgi:predicted GNAT family N-acyltransferase
MRVWDVPVKELDDRALLGEHRELHGLFNVLTLGRRGYAAHPETLRWRGHLRALVARHDAEVAEFRRRGWPSGDSHATPLEAKGLPARESAEPPPRLQSLAEQRRLLKQKAGRRRPAGLSYELLEGAEAITVTLPLRMQVFVGEQGVPPALEPDEHDARALHAVARARGRVIATGRLFDDGGIGRIGRMAVEREFRGRGLGREILLLLMGEARRRGFKTLRLHAQCHARKFYAREGFRDCSEVFVEAGLDHVEMEKRLR